MIKSIVRYLLDAFQKTLFSIYDSLLVPQRKVSLLVFSEEYPYYPNPRFVELCDLMQQSFATTHSESLTYSSRDNYNQQGTHSKIPNNSPLHFGDMSVEFKNLLLNYKTNAFDCLLSSKADFYYHMRLYSAYIVCVGSNIRLQANTMYQIFDLSKMVYQDAVSPVDEIPRMLLNHKPILFWIHSDDESFIKEISVHIHKAASISHYEQDKLFICHSSTIYLGMEWFLSHVSEQ